MQALSDVVRAGQGPLYRLQRMVAGADRERVRDGRHGALRLEPAAIFAAVAQARKRRSSRSARRRGSRRSSGRRWRKACSRASTGRAPRRRPAAAPTATSMGQFMQSWLLARDPGGGAEAAAAGRGGRLQRSRNSRLPGCCASRTSPPPSSAPAGPSSWRRMPRHPASSSIPSSSGKRKRSSRGQSAGGRAGCAVRHAAKIALPAARGEGQEDVPTRSAAAGWARGGTSRLRRRGGRAPSVARSSANGIERRVLAPGRASSRSCGSRRRSRPSPCRCRPRCPRARPRASSPQVMHTARTWFHAVEHSEQ